MTTKVKNTFIEVADGEGSPGIGMRKQRRNKTEPFGNAGFLQCMDMSSAGDDEPDSDGERQGDEQAQPSIAYTKTFDPFDGNKSGAVKDPNHPTIPPALGPSGGGSPAHEMNLDRRSAAAGAEALPGEARATPGKRRVAFLCGADPESDEEADQPGGIAYTKTYDNFETPLASHLPSTTLPLQTPPLPQHQPPPPPAAQTWRSSVSQQQPQPQQQQLQQPIATTVVPQPASAQPVQMAMPMMQQSQPMMQQSQVFTIPVPCGMPEGSSSAVQVPMGLPPGSTIIVMATNMTAGGVTAAPAAAAAPQMTVAAAAPSMPAASSSMAASEGGAMAPPMLPMMSQAPAAPLSMAQQVAASSSTGSPTAGQPLAPQTISKTLRIDGTLQVMYVVDARKLKVNDKVIISPSFELSGGHPGQYRIIINPSPIKARGGPTFKNTGGLGNVQLKCEDRNEGRISFQVYISDGRPNSLRREAPRGPVEHDFADGSVCGLAKKVEEWDFNKVVDNHSRTFAVCLEILP